MAQEITEHKNAQRSTDLPTDKNSDISAQMAAQVTMALSTLDSRYKENVANYAQELHECTHKIEMEKISLEQLYKEKEPHRNALLSVEKEVDHGLRMLEHFTEEWIQKTMVVAELEKEMKQLELLQEQERTFSYRREELKGLQEEIDDVELNLLQHELQRQNLLLKIEPIDHKISALQKKIRELESQKQYIESSYLHRITQVSPGKQFMQIDGPVSTKQ